MKSVTGFGEISHRFWGNLTPILRKSVTDFEEICPGVWGNPSPILGKSVTDVEEIWEICHRLWGNSSPTLGKSGSAFGKISHRLRKAVAVFGKDRLRFGLAWDKAQVSCVWFYFFDWVLPKKVGGWFPQSW